MQMKKNWGMKKNEWFEIFGRSIYVRGVCSTFDVNDVQAGIENLNLDMIHNIQKYETEKSRRCGRSQHVAHPIESGQ